MKIVLKGKANKHQEVVGMITEDKLINPNEVNSMLDSKNLEIEKVEYDGTQKIVYIKEKKTNLLQE